MQVNQSNIHQRLSISEAPLELKQGEVYRASVKEKLNDHDAILNIRGKEVRAAFSDEVPATGNRVTIIVNGQSDGMVNVKTVATEQAKTESAEEKIFRSLGLTGKEQADVKQAVRALLDKGAPLSKEIVRDLKAFMEQTKGTAAAKMETVRALANKGLEATQSQLRAVHEALHGRPLNEVLTNITKEIDPNFKLEKTEAGSGRQPQPIVHKENGTTVKDVELQQANAKRISYPAAERVKASQRTQNELSAKDMQLSNLVRKSRELIEKEPDLKKTIQHVRQEVVKNPNIDRGLAQKIEKAAQEAEKLQTIGKERLVQALKKAEEQLVKLERPPSQAVNEEIQLQQIGRELTGKERLQMALTKAEAGLKQIESFQQVQATQADKSPSGSTQSAQSVQPIQDQDSQLIDLIKQVRQQIQTETDIQKIVQKVLDLVTNTKSISPEITRNIERFANQASQLDQAGRERLTETLQQAETTIKANGTPSTGQESNNQAQKELPAINNAQQQSSVSGNQETVQQGQEKPNEIRLSQAVKQALTQLQKEPNLEKVLDQVRKELTSHPHIDLKTIDKAEKAINQAQQLQDKGRELAARQHITKELTEIQQDLAKTEPKPNIEQKAAQEALQYDINEQLQSLGIQSKDILVTKVSQKLAQATHDFRALKREISRNLDNVQRFMQTYKNQSQPQAKQILEATISKLDNAILKSDMMLFTDMKTEKQLMQASTQLAEAKKLLAKGDHVQAGKMVHEVKTLIDKMFFKPSEQKIVHYVDKESMKLGQRSPAQQMLSKFSEVTQNALQQEPSARQMYEMVRSLGLNHESEVANSLVFHKNDQNGQNQPHEQNLKEVLMKLAQGEGQETNPRIVQQAEQALTNLTGQQLLSKSDAGGTLQSMFFTLPLLLGGKPENLQVFINSKTEGQQVEWENCNLYFLIETKKLGDVGILLNSTDRNLSITIKNDLPGFSEKMEPLAHLTKEKLQEIGYNVTNINFAKMNPAPSEISHEELGEEIKQEKSTRKIFNEKGVNFTI